MIRRTAEESSEVTPTDPVPARDHAVSRRQEGAPIRKRSLTVSRTADRPARTFLLVNFADDVGDVIFVCATYPEPVVALEVLKAWAIDSATVVDLFTLYP